MPRFASYGFVLLLSIAPALVRPQSVSVIRPELVDPPGFHRGLPPHAVVQRPRVALILSGGGARGIAQIGVLKSLERHEIPIDFISGTSLGAIVGGLYASGYTVAEMESLVLSTDWDELLSLTDETRRRELFLDQKLADDRSFLVVRFQGLEPVFPSAVSSGQRLTNFLSTKTLQAPYHPIPDFDDLRVPFRAVTTDLISGQRVVLREGSLAEALRASSTVPLLFSPMEKGEMQLIDGGLVTNIPVDVAIEEGYNLTLAVNSTSGLRSAEELKAPWQTADQIMGIMMQTSNRQQLGQADIVLIPEIGKHLSSDFRGLDTLIAAGERATEERIGEIRALYESRVNAMIPGGDRVYRNADVQVIGEGFPPRWLRGIRRQMDADSLTERDVRRAVHDLYDAGDVREAFAVIAEDSSGTTITYHAVPAARVYRVVVEGCRRISCDELLQITAPLVDKLLNPRRNLDVREALIRRYRADGFSLARVDSMHFDEESGTLRIIINEGLIHQVLVHGAVHVSEDLVLRDFPLRRNQVFQIDEATAGITNITSTKIFEFVYLEVSYAGNKPVLTIRVRERPSQLVRLGLRADNERQLQGAIEIRDENFYGTASELGLTLSGGSRNQSAALAYRAKRLFGTYFTIGFGAFYRGHNAFLYADGPPTGANSWQRLQVGEYRDITYGTSLTVGSLLERLGDASVNVSVLNAQTRSLAEAAFLEDRYRLVLVRFRTVVDSKDQYPFPLNGVGLDLSYEFASKRLGSERGYNALRLTYESFSTWGEIHTFHPRFAIGVADKTMPLTQQFRLGGRESFYGTNEDDRRGRQLFVVNLEYRYRLPFKVVFTSYLSARYDMATISSEPEEIKFSSLRHGVGLELGLDSPLGQVTLALGKSFYFSQDPPKNPIQHGPILLYFMMGYDL